MDDATSTIYSAFLVDEEGTASRFRALLEVFTAHGLPSSFYPDRGSHYFYTPEADGPVDKVQLTQVGRALKHLGIEHIPAYSPEARGRSERMFGTLQDRLIKELAQAGISEMAAANAWIREVYLPRHNARFAKPPALPQSAFVTADAAVLAETLCVQDERVVARDNTVSYGGLKLQLPPKPAAPSLRQGAGAGARISGQHACGVPRPALPRPRRCRGPGNRGSPDAPKRDTVLAAVKAWPGNHETGASRTVTVPAILDAGCARRHFGCAGRDEETAARSNQDTARQQDRDRRNLLRSPTPAGASTASKPPGSLHPRSGHLMCCQNRTS